MTGQWSGVPTGAAVHGVSARVAVLGAAFRVSAASTSFRFMGLNTMKRESIPLDVKVKEGWITNRTPTAPA
jgi:hypothetical protein